MYDESLNAVFEIEGENLSPGFYKHTGPVSLDEERLAEMGFSLERKENPPMQTVATISRHCIKFRPVNGDEVITARLRKVAKLAPETDELHALMEAAGISLEVFEDGCFRVRVELEDGLKVKYNRKLGDRATEVVMYPVSGRNSWYFESLDDIVLI